jgi:5-methylcytosine-specific restriction protein A
MQQARRRLATIGPRIPLFDARAVKPPPKKAAAIYHTSEYAVWREAVIANAGGMCQWPGCGRAEQRMYADHIIELEDGGARFDVNNGQCLCGSHHTRKTLDARARRHGLRR